MLKEPKYYTN